MKTTSFHTTFFRYMVALFIPVHLGILAILLYVSVIQVKNGLKGENIVRENLLKENSAIVRNTLDQIYSDIGFLSELPEARSFYNKIEGYSADLSTIFCAFARNRKLYHQIRIIDTLGWEKIRVDFRDENVLVYPKEQLQNKSDRYYFQAVQQLHPGQFYISSFDLNIEHSSIEIPFVPVLRFGKCISDPVTGQRIFLVMNFLGNEMLDQMRYTSIPDSTKLYLLDQEGYYMIGPTRQSEWRFSFPDSLEGKFGYAYSSEWEAIKSNKVSGHIKTRNGYFTFLKINLCDYFLSRSTLEHSLIPRPCRQWILITNDTRNQIFANVYAPVLRKYIIYAIVAGLVLLAFTWIFSKIRYQQIKEKEQRTMHYQFLNTLIETFPHPIFYIDYFNNELGCNEAFEIMTGKQREELMNMHIEKLFGQSDRSMKLKKLGDNTMKVSEMRLKFPDGSIHNLLYYKANILMQSSRIGLVGVFTDITHIREVEVALRESEQKLIQANRTKDRFFSLIAHDLKNPFHAIMGLSHLLKTNYTRISDEDRKNIADNIHQSSENTFQLLINLLDWARIQEGKIQVKPEDVELHQIVKECMALMIPKIEEKKLHATLNLDYEIRVTADKNMIRTIFRNLIGNAIKFTEEGGRIHISARPVIKNIEISITDTGIGINPEDLKCLFKLDKKRQSHSNDGLEGTGLGLILCNEFVEMNQGRIWAESIVGKGSIFYFTLPQSPDQNQSSI